MKTPQFLISLAAISGPSSEFEASTRIPIAEARAVVDFWRQAGSRCGLARMRRSTGASATAFSAYTKRLHVASRPSGWRRQTEHWHWCCCLTNSHATPSEARRGCTPPTCWHVRSYIRLSSGA